MLWIFYWGNFDTGSCTVICLSSCFFSFSRHVYNTHISSSNGWSDFFYSNTVRSCFSTFILGFNFANLINLRFQKGMFTSEHAVCLPCLSIKGDFIIPYRRVRPRQFFSIFCFPRQKYLHIVYYYFYVYEK